MRELRRRLGISLCCAFVGLIGAFPASADWMDLDFFGVFDNLTNNSGIANSLEPQLAVHVTMYDEMTAEFTFYNGDPNNPGDAGSDGNPDVSSTIAEIYWDWEQPGALDPGEDGEYFRADDTAWELAPPDSVNPSNLPSGANIGFAALAGADGGKKNGVDLGESATFYMGLSSGSTYLDLSDELVSGSLRFGLHVISIGEFSETYYSPPDPDFPSPEDPNVVPAPAALGLGLVGMLLIGVRRATRTSKQS